MKRTYQPSNKRRKRTHGFRKRMKSRGGPPRRHPSSPQRSPQARGHDRQEVTLTHVRSLAAYAAKTFVAPLRKFRFPKTRRVRRRGEYLFIQRAGKKLHSTHFVLLFTRRSSTPATSPPDDGARLGVTITKKLGGAVVRNRVRRLCREVFRAAHATLPRDVDLVLIPKDRAVRVGFFELQQEFGELCKRAF